MMKAASILDELHCPFIINQNRYSIFDRTIERNGLKDAAVANGFQSACSGTFDRPLFAWYP